MNKGFGDNVSTRAQRRILCNESNARWGTHQCSDKDTGSDGRDRARAYVASDTTTSGEKGKDIRRGFDGLYT